jgi:hypothetical protein
LKQKDVENIFQLALLAYAYDPTTWGGDAKDHEFDASLNYIAKTCLKKK